MPRETFSFLSQINWMHLDFSMSLCPCALVLITSSIRRTFLYFGHEWLTLFSGIWCQHQLQIKEREWSSVYSIKAREHKKLFQTVADKVLDQWYLIWTSLLSQRKCRSLEYESIPPAASDNLCYYCALGIVRFQFNICFQYKWKKHCGCWSLLHPSFNVTWT